MTLGARLSLLVCVPTATGWELFPSVCPDLQTADEGNSFCEQNSVEMPFYPLLWVLNFKLCDRVLEQFFECVLTAYLFAFMPSECGEGVKIVCAMSGCGLVWAKARRMYDKQNPFLLL